MPTLRGGEGINDGVGALAKTATDKPHEHDMTATPHLAKVSPTMRGQTSPGRCASLLQPGASLGPEAGAVIYASVCR